MRFSIVRITEDNREDHLSRGRPVDRTRRDTERGWIYDDEKLLNGLRCVSVAVLDTEDRVLGSIGISGPSSRLTDFCFVEKFPQMPLDVKNVIEQNTDYN